MKNNLEKLSETSVKLTIEVKLNEVDDIISSVYNKASENLNVAGFRKGKVPKPVIEQKVGIPFLLNEISNDVISKYYQEVALSNDLKVMRQPEIDVKELFDLKDAKSKMVFEATVDVRPEIKIPSIKDQVITVEVAEVTKDAVETELKLLQERLSTKNEDGSIETPELNDDFAMSYGVDSLDELKNKVTDDLKNRNLGMSVREAGDKALENLLSKVKFDLPKKVIEEQVNHFLENGGAKDSKKPTNEEIKLANKRAESDIKAQVLLDSYADENDIKVSQEEIINYISNTSYQYGVPPEQFIQMIIQNNQLPSVAAEVSRSKTLAHMLKQSKVVDQDKNELDLSPWIGGDEEKAESKSSVKKKSSTKQRKTKADAEKTAKVKTEEK